MHVEKFFARNLGSLIRVRTGKPGRFMELSGKNKEIAGQRCTQERFLPPGYPSLELGTRPTR